MKKLFLTAIILVAVIIIAGVAWWFFKSSNPEPPNSNIPGSDLDLIFRPDAETNQIYQAAGEAGETAGKSKNQTTDNSGNNFTFQYPEKFNVTQTDIEGRGKRILVESSKPKNGFEITILPFDEPGPLTAERIKQDLPEMKMENVRELPLPLFTKEESEGSSIPALAFNSQDENIGPTFEIWFAHGGYSYQALTYPEFGPAMEEILKTWKFK